MFESPFGESILKRAQDQELLNISLHDLRKYTLDKHRKTDDHPCGGGVWWFLPGTVNLNGKLLAVSCGAFCDTAGVGFVGASSTGVSSNNRAK